jgi:hypothetical protein
MVEIGLRPTYEAIEDTTAHIAEIRCPLSEVRIVHAGEDLGLFGGHAVDGLLRGRARLDGGDRRVHDPRVAGEDRLGLEDATDVRTRQVGSLTRELLELCRSDREGVEQPAFLDSGSLRSGPSLAPGAADSPGSRMSDAIRGRG